MCKLRADPFRWAPEAPRDLHMTMTDLKRHTVAHKVPRSWRWLWRWRRGVQTSKQHTVAPEVPRDTMIDIVVESWRFAHVFNHLLLKLDAGEQKQYKSRRDWFRKEVEKSLGQVNLKIVNVEGCPFDPGMAVTPLNIGEFDAAKDELVVDHMIEPIIMGEEGLVVRRGKVTLRKVMS